MRGQPKTYYLQSGHYIFQACDQVLLWSIALDAVAVGAQQLVLLRPRGVTSLSLNFRDQIYSAPLIPSMSKIIPASGFSFKAAVVNPSTLLMKFR